MNHEPIRDFNLVDPPQRSRRPVVALLLAIALGVLLADVASAQERYGPSTRSSRAAVEELAYRHFPAHLVGWAVSTAACESSFDLRAYSSGYDRRYGWYEHVGAWQISGPTWRAKAWALFGGPLEDPEVNAAMAAWIATNLGISHWPVCGYRGGW